jgi:hypothetical protein
MEEISPEEFPHRTAPKRGPDLVNALLVMVTIIFLIGSCWIRFGTSTNRPSLAVGDLAPSLHLRDLNGEPLIVLGLWGKVVWLTFWSATSREGLIVVDRLDQIWRGLDKEGGFASFSLVIDDVEPEIVRDLIATRSLRLPAYLASAETCRDYGAAAGDLPLHVVINDDGRILAITRGSDLEEIEEMVKARLRVLHSAGGALFAAIASRDARSGTDVVGGAMER